MNPDIITALKNGISKGESFEMSKRILINSGYNPGEVEEASRYVGQGIMQTLQPRKGESLTMPEQKKSFFSRFKKNKKSLQAPNKNPSIQAKEIKTEVYKREVPKQLPLSTAPLEIKKKFWIKEILLFITLITLIGVLVITIFFKDKFLAIFGG